MIRLQRNGKTISVSERLAGGYKAKGWEPAPEKAPKAKKPKAKKLVDVQTVQ